MLYNTSVFWGRLFMQSTEHVIYGFTEVPLLSPVFYKAK
jgi:hypothetical protein